MAITTYSFRGEILSAGGTLTKTFDVSRAKLATAATGGATYSLVAKATSVGGVAACSVNAYCVVSTGIESTAETITALTTEAFIHQTRAMVHIAPTLKLVFTDTASITDTVIEGYVTVFEA